MSKVSSIVSEGVTVGQNQTVAPVQFGDKTHLVPVRRQVTSYTMLAQKLGFPDSQELEEVFRTRYPSPSLQPARTLATAVLLFIFFDVLIGALSLISVFGWNFLTTLVVALLIGMRVQQIYSRIVFPPSLRAKDEEWTAQKKEWFERVKAIWIELYYCGRDDVLFDSSKREAPAERIRDLTYGKSPNLTTLCNCI